MTATSSGPQLAALVHRLAECPGEFLLEPRVEQKGPTYSGTVHVDAIATDLIRFMGAPMPDAADTAELRQGRGTRPPNHLRLASIACWLLHDDWFRNQRVFAEKVLDLLVTRLVPLANLVMATEFVNDSERREELVRFCLGHFGARPAGESLEQAADRLAALDSVERARVVRDAKRAEERARAIREAMAKKEAEEAAARYGRE